MVPCCALRCQCLSPPGILTSSLLPLKASEATDSPPVLEVQEFPLLDSPEWLASSCSHLTFQHHFYVYPEFLKFDNQKQVTLVTVVNV